MITSDLIITIRWYLTILIIGSIFLPITISIFSNFIDRGYIFSKTIGIILISYLSFLLGIFHIAQFSRETLFLICASAIIIDIFILLKNKKILKHFTKKNFFLVIIFEEILFFILFYFFALIRSYSPDIHGLEKYMDLGFINSIIRSDFFPPVDIWFPPESINYYYFGHLSTAVISVISNISSNYSFNLMLATILGLCFMSVFSLTLNIISGIFKTKDLKIKIVFSALLSSFIVTFSGNLHVIYSFFKPYENERPVPPWELVLNIFNFPNSYWYPNATRFIYNTIHEFPQYSWVVSDLHGHVLDIPFVLLTISILYVVFVNKKNYLSSNILLSKKNFHIISIGFMLSILYMTNAWDGIIYFLLAFIIIVYINTTVNNHSKAFLKNFQETVLSKKYIFSIFISLIFLILSTAIFLKPFNMYFKPFVSGIGLLCAPKFLTNIEKIGPFIFEINHCQKSPIWQLFILHGYFILLFLAFIYLIRKKGRLFTSDIFILFLNILSLVLIIIPEFIYAKDIYPAHYRANTMFKLVFQSYIMFGISSGYILFRLFSTFSKSRKITYFIFSIISFVLTSIIFIYPYLSFNSYYGNFKEYKGLDGTKYLSTLYPSDFEAIRWINKNIKGQPVILEAQGDSYTDYARISVNTGLPTVLGWTVHEWLWRGSYDIPSPRISDISFLYESDDIVNTKKLLKKYSIKYIYIGQLEKEKYPNLNDKTINNLGKIIYQNSGAKIYKVDI